jgi:hypothetical protein
MALTVRRAGPNDYGTWVKALIAGEPGAGKTRTASTWPGVLYADAEGGQLSVADRQPPSIAIDSTATLTELHSALTQKGPVREKMLGFDVQTVVIDTLDEIARLFIRERLASEHKESMAIQDWGWLGDRLRDLVRGWRNLDMNVLFLVHVKAQEDSETGRVTYKPSIQGAMGDELAAYVDLAVLLRARPTATVVEGKNVRIIQRFLQTYPDAQFPWVKDRSGRLPMDFPINMNDDYARLREAIFGNVVQAGTPQAAVIAPERPPVAPQTAPGGPRQPPPPPPVQAPPMGPDPDAEAAAPPAEPTVVPPEVAAAGTTEEPGVHEVVTEVIPESEPLAQPEPEDVTPEPEPEPAPDPEPVATAPPEPAPAPLSNGNGAAPTGGLEEWQICESCGNQIETKDHGDLSFIRFKARLCRSCFAERKKVKA